jgi:hypothetical protein
VDINGSYSHQGFQGSLCPHPNLPPSGFQMEEHIVGTRCVQGSWSKFDVDAYCQVPGSLGAPSKSPRAGTSGTAVKDWAGGTVGALASQSGCVSKGRCQCT